VPDETGAGNPRFTGFSESLDLRSPYAAGVSGTTLRSAAQLVELSTAVADGLRRMTERKLARPAPASGSTGGSTGRTVAGAALDAARALARAAQGVDERDAAGEPVWRLVPDLGALTVGDQIAVTGHELARAVAALPDGDDPLVWTPGGRRPASELLDEVTGELVALRGLPR
jgi:hypothetical protein